MDNKTMVKVFFSNNSPTRRGLKRALMTANGSALFIF